MSIQNWSQAQNVAKRNRLMFLVTSFALVLPFAWSVWRFNNPPQGWDSFVLLCLVALTACFSFLTVRDSHRRYQKRHQRDVLPMLLSSETALKSVPDGGVSLLTIDPSRLFPKVEKAHMSSYLRGSIADHLVEVCEMRLTRQKIKRKVRKIQVPVFEGVCFQMDLGSPVLSGDVHIFGPRAGRSFAQKRLCADMFPYLMSRCGFGVRAWGQWGGRRVLSKAARQEIKAISRLAPSFRMSLYNGRQLMIVMDKNSALFRPAGVFFTPRRDPNVGRVLELMRRIVRLGVILGAEPTLVQAALNETNVESEKSLPVARKKPEARLASSVGFGWPKMPVFKNKPVGPKSSERVSKFDVEGFGLMLGRRVGRIQRRVFKEGGAAQKGFQYLVESVEMLAEKISHTNAGEAALEKWDAVRGSKRQEERTAESEEKSKEFLEKVRRYKDL